VLQQRKVSRAAVTGSHWHYRDGADGAEGQVPLHAPVREAGRNGACMGNGNFGVSTFQLQ
jgi:hypothetical protein